VNPHPHELAPLLLALGRAGIELAAHPTDPARLRHRPADLPPDLSARLRIHRAAVLGLLVNGYAPKPHGDTDAGYVLGERLGVADALGMPTHPGSAAWLVAVGEAMVSDLPRCEDGDDDDDCRNHHKHDDERSGAVAATAHPVGTLKSGVDLIFARLPGVRGGMHGTTGIVGHGGTP